MMKMKNFALLSFLVLEFISVSSLIGSQPQGVELNPTGLSRISWMFETSQDDWVNTKSMGGDGHEGDDYYADDWARAAAGGLTGEQRTFGQIVYAGISGIAIVKPNHGDYGNDVIIYDSESTFALRNAHLSEILVNDGQEISAGSPIGKVGDSGNSYGSHLHIALYKNVQDVNDRPITWITFNRGDPPTIPGPPTDFAAPFLYNPRVTPIIIWDSEIANLTHTDPRYTNQEVALTMYVKNTGTQIGTFWFHMIVRQNGFLSDPVVFDQWEKVYDIGVGQTKSHIFSWTPTEDDEYRYEPEVWNVPIDVKYDSWVTEWYPVIDGNILPTISIISGPSGTINYDDVTFSWQGSDTDGKVNGYERMMDGVGASTIFTSEPFNNLPEGSHTFNVRCLDDDGAYSSWATRTFTVDTVLPPVPIISSSTHTEGVWSNNDDPSFSWIEPSDASGIIGYSYYFDQNSSTIPNTTSEGTSKSKGYSNAIDGTWYFHVRAKDGAGNWGSPDHYGPVKIDDTPPTAPISLTALPSDWTNNSVFSIGWTDPSDPSGIDKAYYKIDSAPSGPTDGIWSTINPFPAAATSEGGQAIYVWLMDGAGNLNHNNRDTAILYYDATSPSNPTSCTETHGVQSGVDQNTVNDPNFTWSGASDSASGIDNYYYYWGTNALGTSTTYTALAGYDPSTVSPGTYYLRLKTRDNAGNDASWTAVFTFIYSAPNDPPVIAGIPDQSLDENTSLDNAIDLWTYASDPETPDDGLTYAITGNTNPDCGVSIDTRYIDINPIADWSGTSDVTVTVTDPGSLSNTDTFTVTINPVNDPPVIAGIPDQSLDENTSLDNAIDLWTYASDPETSDDGLTYAVTGNTDPDCGVSIDTNRYMDVNPTADWSGTSDVTVTVTDPGSLFDTDTFTVTINPVNDPPVIAGLPAQSLDENTSLDNSIDLWSYASDSETSDNGLTFDITGNTESNCGVSIDAQRYIDINPVADWYGQSEVTIRVTDPGSLYNEDIFQITVNPVFDSITFDLLDGWNGVSCPGDPVVDDWSTVIAGNPDISMVVEYDTTADPRAFVMATDIQFGKSYFIGATNDTEINLEYLPRESLSQSAVGGWSPLGSISCSIPASNVTSSDPSDQVVQIVRFDNNDDTDQFVVASTIEPGVGYMVGCLDACTLSMDCTSLAPPVQRLATKPSSSWEGMLSVQTQTDHKEFVFGMNDSASDGVDLYDSPVPPMLDMSDMTAGWVIKNSFFDLFEKSFVKDDKSANWELSVELTEYGDISWDNLPKRCDFTLLYGDIAFDMHREQSLSLPIGKHTLLISVNLNDNDYIVEKTRLLANYPNPCNPETWIPYELSTGTDVRIMIYTLNGALVRSLDLGHRPAGRYADRSKAAHWDGKNESGEKVSSGIYFYILVTPDFSEVRKLLITR